MAEHGSGDGSGSTGKRALQLAAEVLRKRYGDDAAEEFIAQFERTHAAAEAMETRGSAPAVRAGEGKEEAGATAAPPKKPRPKSHRNASSLGAAACERRVLRTRAPHLRAARALAVTLRGAARRQTEFTRWPRG